MVATKPPAARSGWQTWSGAAGVPVFYAAVVLLTVRRWGSPDPWSRLDAYSGGYLALSLALFVQQAVFAARFTRSDEVRTAFYSLQIDPGFARWSVILGLAEILVFLDYAHWRLMPALDAAGVKTAGLVLYVLTVAWLFHVDRFLFRNFAGAMERGVLLTGGPYRRVRHPRYTGLVFTRVSLALMLASPIGWCLCGLWWLLVERRIRREERYLQARFGSAYQAYAARTPQLIPAVRLRG